jgi:hypothetical protein
MSASFSVIMHTCRVDNQALPSNVLKMMVDAVVSQNYDGYVELIIVDLLYEKRKDQIKDILKPALTDKRIPVLYIPDKNSKFKEQNLMRISGPKNTGVIFARGESLIFTDDSQVIPINALTLLSEWAEQDIGATMCYEKRIWGKGIGTDRVTGRDNRGDLLCIPSGTAAVLQNGHVGFMGGTMSMLPIDTVLGVNGWDEMFDGSRQLEDSDMAARVFNYGQKMAYENRAFVTEYECHEIDNSGYDPDVISVEGGIIKCNVPYAESVISSGRVRANTKISGDVITTLGPSRCSRLRGETMNICSLRMKVCPWLYKAHELENIYRDSRMVFDLKNDRKIADWENAVEIIKEQKEGKEVR